ncbi:hypothetical protein QBC42DRAFT_266095 [Cladorrhinum samala]|uniref:Uncharacterized protein n=1 Tax=Cladorrhinum samala TaxID=585594 RepID=A0AAV9HTK7_9PEZI|nr:hypothetical protein QBC42DRAFT_266095 [Cladorrhinum samala]
MVLNYIRTYRLVPSDLKRYLEELFPSSTPINVLTNKKDMYVVETPVALSPDQVEYIYDNLRN